MHKATADMPPASVHDMSGQLASPCFGGRNRKMIRMPSPSKRKRLFAACISTSVLAILLLPAAYGAGLQSNPATAAQTSSPNISETLRPALDQVGHALGQIKIDHWKISKTWKDQLQSDADSISSDLTHQLPGLMQQAQSTPAALDGQLRVMQNVGALYDVLVRLTLAADMNEKKSDAALLDSALQQLETARKQATTELVNAAAAQHQQLVQLQAEAAAAQPNSNTPATPGKTIVVDNEGHHGTVHHAAHHKKPSPSTAAKTQPAATPSTTDKPAPQ